MGLFILVSILRIGYVGSIREVFVFVCLGDAITVVLGKQCCWSVLLVSGFFFVRMTCEY
jgi:hypothetical protein